MGLHLADFITGRAISSGDEIIALVIVPAIDGYPDPVKAAAYDPIYPSDRFEPISLPLRGRMNDYGFFVPYEDQFSLQVFLDTAQVKDWAEFAEQAFNAREEPFTFKDPNPRSAAFFGPGLTACPGLATLHSTTFNSMISAGSRDVDYSAAIDSAVAIARDASHQWHVDKNDRYFNYSMLRVGSDKYTMLNGSVVDVPDVLQVLENGNIRLNREVERTLRRMVIKPHLADDTILYGTFGALSDYMRLSLGLHYTGRYWAPPKFARHDNLRAIALMQVKDLEASLTGYNERLSVGPEWCDSPDNTLLELRDRLTEVLAAVENELDQYRSYKPSL